MAGKGVKSLAEAMRGLSIASQTCRTALPVCTPCSMFDLGNRKLTNIIIFAFQIRPYPLTSVRTMATEAPAVGDTTRSVGDITRSVDQPWQPCMSTGLRFLPLPEQP